MGAGGGGVYWKWSFQWRITLLATDFRPQAGKRDKQIHRENQKMKINEQSSSRMNSLLLVNSYNLQICHIYSYFWTLYEYTCSKKRYHCHMVIALFHLQGADESHSAGSALQSSAGEKFEFWFVGSLCLWEGERGQITVVSHNCICDHSSASHTLCAYHGHLWIKKVGFVGGVVSVELPVLRTVSCGL